MPTRCWTPAGSARRSISWSASTWVRGRSLPPPSASPSTTREHSRARSSGWWRLRCAALRLPYGDQGLLIPKRLYDEVGGYRPLPLMEDVDLVRRLGRRRTVMLRSRAVTSAERFRRDGYVRRSTRNLLCLALYTLRVPAHVISRIYG